jgi:uncharacterized protein (DUF1800 family)
VIDTRSAHAAIRFGLGSRPTDVVPIDPVRWAEDQLNAPDPALRRDTPSTANAWAVGLREAAVRSMTGSPPPSIGDLYRTEQPAMLHNAVDTALPFRERLVWFWANHFTVSAKAGSAVLAVLGAYWQEAIRPNVTGRFADMLRATMQHSAMLFYLDNAGSVGPNSARGVSQHIGLNENLARECLELHTVGVDGGYTQQDVANFARILTGWTAEWGKATVGFQFKPEMHEPGEKIFMGQRFPEGRAGGEAALDCLARHPATFHHLAGKLVRHFVDDTPPPAAVTRIETVLCETDGDLAAAALAIVALPEAWKPLTKLRTPVEYVVAVTRALGLPPDPRHQLSSACHAMGQPFMAAPLPNGWPDTMDAWLSGETLLRRADWAMTQASRAPQLDPQAVMATTLGDLASKATLRAVHEAPSRVEAMGILLASPEFMRR